ncbi:MAG: hypothetical protein A2X61_08905 [Ignavibacteria bacterium GWB2_35_12]|nr:MAG: hypothetical protein A2X63_04315 [Ignavibacteria bacterium GWA2_35_8]OGU40610.1 MAG: hypothetical protein A2X61_08905 [Ignavibacteria bacterium GWB2_35_12]OGU91674.1 MAG: hypothetical protein A2220_10555 [Ignavibacteria bacterium RIFOXYA2_FULL_35_10]OGV22644.1 MAG: hypothetical protein A2475_13100 [Ignavibacteria bacterium RIFOXYC2_FULL_35_21]
MENFVPNRDLTNKEMQEMLPDYVFGRLSTDDIQLYEYYLPNYPDLVDEIKQVKAVFGKVEKMDFDKKISQKTRNLSIKVMNRMEAKTAKQRRFSFAARYIVPTVGLAVVLILIFVINPNLENSKMGNNKIDGKFGELQVLKNNDALTLFDSPAMEADYLALSTNLASENVKELSNPGMDEGTAQSLWEDFISEHISSGLTGIETSLASMPDQHNYNLMNEMNNLEENDFQNILEEISNVKFTY